MKNYSRHTSFKFSFLFLFLFLFLLLIMQLLMIYGCKKSSSSAPPPSIIEITPPNNTSTVSALDTRVYFTILTSPSASSRIANGRTCDCVMLECLYPTQCREYRYYQYNQKLIFYNATTNYTLENDLPEEIVGLYSDFNPNNITHFRWEMRSDILNIGENEIHITVQDTENGASSTEIISINVPNDAPTLSAISQEFAIKLSWQPIYNAYEYYLYWSEQPGVTPENGNLVIIPAYKSGTLAETSFTHSNVTQDQPNYYIIQAVSESCKMYGFYYNGCFHTKPSQEIAAMSMLIIPSPVTSINSTRFEPHKISYSWIDANGAASYNLYWGFDSTITKDTAYKIPNITQNSYTLDNLPEDTDIYLFIESKNSIGVSELSNLIATRTKRAMLATKIATGHYHSLVLLQDGTLWSWGKQPNVNFDVKEPLQIGTAHNWVDIYARSFSSFALNNLGQWWHLDYDTEIQFNSLIYVYIKSDGTLWAGDTQVGIGNDWKVVVSSFFHFLALKQDGSLYGWGENYFQEAGVEALNCTNNSKFRVNASIDSPTRIGNKTWKKIFVGRFKSAAIDSNGDLYTWGKKVLTKYRCSAIPTLALSGPVKTFDFAESLDLAIKSDGTLWYWGMHFITSPYEFQIILPTQIGLDTDWTDLATGKTHWLLLKTDGTVWSEGLNYQPRQLGY